MGNAGTAGWSSGCRAGLASSEIRIDTFSLSLQSRGVPLFFFSLFLPDIFFVTVHSVQSAVQPAVQSAVQSAVRSRDLRSGAKTRQPVAVKRLSNLSTLALKKKKKKKKKDSALIPL